MTLNMNPYYFSYDRLNKPKSLQLNTDCNCRNGIALCLYFFHSSSEDLELMSNPYLTRSDQQQEEELRLSNVLDQIAPSVPANYLLSC